MLNEHRSMLRGTAHLAAVAALVLSCSSGTESTEETVAAARQPVFSADNPTSVVPGSGTPPPSASCPGNKLPDQCGSWQGVELTASHGRGNVGAAAAERCVCSPIAFQVPAALPVSTGNAGVFDATLSFRRTDGRFVDCRYKGNARFGHSPKATGGDAYELDRCSDGSKAGASLNADWFKLVLKGSDPQAPVTEVNLRLGAPDVVDGVVQEEIIYASDPRIAGAALHVPRGSAPSGQQFTLSVLSEVPPETTIGNAGKPLQTVGYAVDVHATGADNFTFASVPGAGCPRIELPYSPDSLLAVAGPDAEGRVRARQIIDLAAVASGGESLVQTGGITLDPVRHVASFCVQHLSFYVTGVNLADAQLNSAFLAASSANCATIADCGTGEVCANGGCYKSCTTTCSGGLTCFAPSLPYCYQDVLTAPPTALKPGMHNKLRLVFQNEGPTTAAGTWNAGTIALVSATPRIPSGPGTTVTPLASSPWFGGNSFSTAVPGSVAGGSPTPALSIELTTPVQKLPTTAYPYGSALNLCLQNGAGILGECFSWDYPPHSTASYGAGLAPIAEVCDGIDNAGNGVDSGFGTGVSCDNGAKGVCNRTGHIVCASSSTTTCDAPFIAPTTSVDACGNNADDNCNGPVDEGCVCGDGAVAGSEQCDDGNTAAGDGCSASCLYEPKHVFVTSQAFHADFGGLASADAICQSLASNPATGLTGTYKAWLSTTTVSASSRLTHHPGPYVLVNGVEVSASWTELTGGFLRHPIDLTELGGTPPDGKPDNFPPSDIGCGHHLVWTDTSDNGEHAQNGPTDCSAWTDASATGGGLGAIWGTTDRTTHWSGWCQGGTCESTAPLFCFEQ